MRHPGFGPDRLIIAMHACKTRSLLLTLGCHDGRVVVLVRAPMAESVAVASNSVTVDAAGPIPSFKVAAHRPGTPCGAMTGRQEYLIDGRPTTDA